MPLYLGEEKISQISIGGTNVEPLSITANGTYTAPSGIAYSPITVNVSGGGGGSYPWFGPNTVKDYTKTITINLANDTSWDSWTASTTAAVILSSPTTNDFSYTFDYTQYSGWIVTTVITNYVYKSNATKQKIPISSGRLNLVPFYGRPSYTSYSDSKNNTISEATFLSNTISSTLIYYYGSTGSKTSTNSSYGAYTDTYPTLTQSTSGNNCTIGYQRPAIKARCSTNVFATARKSDIDSENTNVVITVDIYKTPRSNSLFPKTYDSLLTAMNSAPEA